MFGIFIVRKKNPVTLKNNLPVTSSDIKQIRKNGITQNLTLSKATETGEDNSIL